MNIDGALDNADWPKRTWDLFGTPDQIASDLYALGTTSEAFAARPMARSNPEEAAPVIAALQRIERSARG